ncbi:cytochrome c oxidase assembly protein [Terrabacter sp. GCM10028922]|uniref:cytochrome c oxidase assembly protein n=1 Tax=Terrabacter sp. GCM10028922 TaxID=3273428 RepID=UPI00360988F4
MTGPMRPDHEQAVDELRTLVELPRPEGVRPSLAPLLAMGAGIVATVVAAWSTGAMAPLVFVEDAGPLVRWSVPVVRVVHDVAAAVTLAALVFAASIVPAPERSGPRLSAMAPVPAVRLATGAGFVWAITALAGVVLTFADAAGLPLSDPALAPQLGELAWEIDATRIGLISAACAFVVASGAAVARGRVAAAWLGGVAGSGILVLGLASHTGASDDHETSVNAMGLHLVGATLWVGGLVVLILLHRVLTDLPRVARRYSSLALLGFITIAVSGVLAATTRLGSWGDLSTAYGLLLVVKALVLVALGVAGWRHRHSTIVTLEAGVRPRAFLRLALGEVVLMGVAIGVGAALSRSAPPVPEDVPDPTPALAVTGFPAPPDPATVAWWSAWRADWLWLALAVVAIGAYAVGVVASRVASARALVESHRVGRHEAPGATARRRASTTVAGWPWWRTASWVLGCLALAWTTSGPVGIYGRVAFSWHAALLAALVFVVAPLLVAGSPLTLAERALVARTDGTLGPRELVVGVGRSGVVGLLTRPVVATALLLAGAVGLHATGLLDLALTTHPGHLVMICASLAVGSLLAAAVLRPSGGGDAVAGPRVPRAVLACLVIVVAAAFATAAWLALTTSVLAGDVYGRLGLPWLSNLAAEQLRGGAVVLFVVVPVCVVLAVPVILRHLLRPEPRGR